MAPGVLPIHSILAVPQSCISEPTCSAAAPLLHQFCSCALPAQRCASFGVRSYWSWLKVDVAAVNLLRFSFNVLRSSDSVMLLTLLSCIETLYVKSC